MGGKTICSAYGRLTNPKMSKPPSGHLGCLNILPDPETVHKIVDAAIRAGAVMEIQSRYMGSSGELGNVVYGITKFEQAYKEVQRDGDYQGKVRSTEYSRTT